MTAAQQESPAPTPPASSLDALLDVSALAFETGVLERLVLLEPGNIDYLAALGQAYSRQRRPRQCLQIDLALVDKQPDEPVFRYNLACSLCLLGDLDGACRELLAAIDLGYRDLGHLEQDPDLAALRDDPRFQRVREHLAATG